MVSIVNEVTTTKPRAVAGRFREWGKSLRSVDDDIRSLTLTVFSRMKKEFAGVNEKTRGRYDCFYIGKPSSKSVFVAFRVNQKSLAIRIRTNSTFKDGKEWTQNRAYRNWFFTKDQEREFKITDKSDIDYAISLISQSYLLVRTRL